MTEKKNETGLAPSTASTDLDMMLSEEIVGSASRPETLERTLDGTEDITTNDVRLPRLTLAQSTSQELTPGKTNYIDGLKMFDMFNNLTGEIYGRGPLKFVPILRGVKRMEYRPRTEGGGLIDPDVPANDPRTRWTVEPDGTRVPPKAVTYVEFVIILLRTGRAPEPVVLSIKNTNKFNRRASDQLTTFIKLRNAAIYAGLYTISSGSETNDSGTFAVPIVKNAGWVPVDTNAGKQLYDFVKNFHDGLDGKVIEVDREPGDDDLDFPGDGDVVGSQHASTGGM